MSQPAVSFVATVYAWDTSAGTYKTGDAANITLYWTKDGTQSVTTNSCSEVSSTNTPGQYKVTITTTEATCTAGTLGGKSSTANIIIIPAQFTFDNSDFTATMKTSIGTAVAASAVASVTGNVGGNVVGSVGSVTGAVGSVTGAVGSVTGNVGGNVVGSVASVTAGVTVTTNNDKTGYALSVAGILAIWHQAVAAIVTAGTIGKLILDNLDAAITSRMATYTQPTGFLAAVFPGTVASPTNITAGVITTVTNLTNAPTAGDLTAAMKASVNAEVVDALTVDTYAEPAAVPAATSSLKDKIGYLFTKTRNKTTQTATTQLVRNNGDSGTIATIAVSDDGTTFTKGLDA